MLVIDTETKAVVAEVPVAAGPMYIAVSSNGNKIYIPSMMGNVVNVITKNDSSWSRTNEISHAGFNMMQGVDQTDDERYLYVSSRNADWSFKHILKLPVMVHLELLV